MSILLKKVTQAALDAVAATILPAASQAETEAATITNKSVVPAYLRIKIVGTAFLAGDLTGNVRGTEAIDVQKGRTAITQVASGNSASCFGVRNTATASQASALGTLNLASGNNSVSIGYSNQASSSGCVSVGANNNTSSIEGFSCAIGYLNTASGDYGSVAMGRANTASGGYSSAVGYSNTASGYLSAAFGLAAYASGDNSVAMGRTARTTVTNTFELGYWSGVTTRTSGVRMHPNGQVAKTIANSATPPTDGGATAGSEANATLPRGMFSIQRNGLIATMYFNDAGTIRSLLLGTLV